MFNEHVYKERFYSFQTELDQYVEIKNIIFIDSNEYEHRSSSNVIRVAIKDDYTPVRKYTKSYNCELESQKDIRRITFSCGRDIDRKLLKLGFIRENNRRNNYFRGACRNFSK